MLPSLLIRISYGYQSQPPPDPEEYIDDEIQRLKDATDDYNGECTPGNEAVNCGRWWKQPIHSEVWCESETIQPDLPKYQEGRNVKIQQCEDTQALLLFMKVVNDSKR